MNSSLATDLVQCPVCGDYETSESLWCDPALGDEDFYEN